MKGLDYFSFNIDISQEKKIIYRPKPRYVYLELFFYLFFAFFVMRAAYVMTDFGLIAVVFMLIAEVFFIINIIKQIRRIIIKDYIVFDLEKDVVLKFNKKVCQLSEIKSIEIVKSYSGGNKATKQKIFLHIDGQRIRLLTVHLDGNDFLSFSKYLAERLGVKLVGNCLRDDSRENRIDFW